MYLEKIDKANDIKKLEVSNLPILAKEVRREIVSVLSGNGGHLASNLGVVELTLALHYLMDFPEDKLIFDVGHQSYIHKLLTGRRETFDSIRKEEGLSGFPNPEESENDLFRGGHASTAIGEGLGLAHARQLKGTKEKIAVVVGDGALTGGLAFEALNNASRLKSNLTIILNDNEMSIDKNVGGISKSLAEIRTSENYAEFKGGVMKSLEKLPGVGDAMVDTLRRAKNGIKQFLVPGMFFEDMGVMYLGPVDGHDMEDLLKVMNQAFRYRGPVVVHVITKKGKGYLPAMKEPARFHGTGPFSVKTGRAKSLPVKTYGEVFSKTLCQMAKEDDKICAITAAMAEGTGLSDFSAAYHSRFFDVGIAEEHAVVLAAALAKAGFKPVVAMYSTFLQRAYDQILMEVCLNRLPVVFAIDRAGFVGEDGATHQGLFDISFLSSMPGMTVMAPKNDRELSAMLEFALNLGAPCAIRYPKGEAYSGLSEKSSPIRAGKCEVINPNGDVLLYALGSMVKTAEEVQGILAKKGINASLVNARFAKPIDKKFLKSKDFSLVLTMEEGIESGSMGRAVQSFLLEQNPKTPVLNICAGDGFVHRGSRDATARRLGMDPKSIAGRIVKALK